MNAETLMKRITDLLLAVAGVVAYMAHAAEEAAPIFLTEIPQGYRDLSLISVSRLTASNGSLTAVECQVAQAILDGAHQICPYSKATPAPHKPTK